MPLSISQGYTCAKFIYLFTLPTSCSISERKNIHHKMGLALVLKSLYYRIVDAIFAIALAIQGACLAVIVT